MTNNNSLSQEVTPADVERAIAEMRRIMDNPPNLDTLDLIEEVQDDAVEGSKTHPGLAILRQQRAALHRALHPDTQQEAANTPHQDGIEQMSHKKPAIVGATVNFESEEENETPNELLLNQNAAEQSQQALRYLMQATHGAKSPHTDHAGGTTLEELVVQLLKPELSNWLNKNLPQIVQSVVEKEIKKLIPNDDA